MTLLTDLNLSPLNQDLLNQLLPPFPVILVIVPFHPPMIYINLFPASSTLYNLLLNPPPFLPDRSVPSTAPLTFVFLPR